MGGHDLAAGGMALSARIRWGAWMMVEAAKKAVRTAGWWTASFAVSSVLAYCVLAAYHYGMPVVIGVEHRIIEMDDKSVTLAIKGRKIRCLSIITSGREAPRYWSYAADGTRSPVKRVPVVGTDPETYPCGWNDFGWYRFIQKRPDAPPPIAYSITVNYADGILGHVFEEIGPMAVR